MKITINSNNNNVIETKSIDYPFGLNIIPYQQKDIFDAFCFKEPEFGVIKILFDDLEVYPSIKNISFLIVDLSFEYFEFSIAIKLDASKKKENKEMLLALKQDIKKIKDINCEKESQEIKNIKDSISLFNKYNLIQYFLVDLNKNTNNKFLYKKVFETSFLTLVLDFRPEPIVEKVVVEKVIEKIVYQSNSVIAEKNNNVAEKKEVNEKHKRKLKNKAKLNRVKNKTTFKEKMSYYFNDIFIPHWGNYLFLFLHSVLITSFFLLGLPLLKNEKFFAIGILFVVIGCICFILALTISFDFSNDVNNTGVRKNKILLVSSQMLALILGIIFGSLLFLSLASNNVLIKLSDFNFNSVIVLLFLFGLIILSAIMFKFSSKISKKFSVLWLKFKNKTKKNKDY